MTCSFPFWCTFKFSCVVVFCVTESRHRGCSVGWSVQAVISSCDALPFCLQFLGCFWHLRQRELPLECWCYSTFDLGGFCTPFPGWESTVISAHCSVQCTQLILFFPFSPWTEIRTLCRGRSVTLVPLSLQCHCLALFVLLNSAANLGLRSAHRDCAFPCEKGFPCVCVCNSSELLLTLLSVFTKRATLKSYLLEMTAAGTEHVKAAVGLGSRAHLQADPLGMALGLGEDAASRSSGLLTAETNECGRWGLQNCWDLPQNVSVWEHPGAALWSSSCPKEFPVQRCAQCYRQLSTTCKQLCRPLLRSLLILYTLNVLFLLA